MDAHIGDSCDNVINLERGEGNADKLDLDSSTAIQILSWRNCVKHWS